MEVATPKDPVYYYEASAGRFRLVYFIPPEELKRLHDAGEIAAKAIEDLPDGVDLGCTEPDFAEFEELYGYRPPHDPEELRRAFFTIFSTTRDWESFRGTGFVAAGELERQVASVDERLKVRDLTPVTLEPLVAQPTLKQRRERMEVQATRQVQIEEVLREMPAEGVDPEKTLREQPFSKIDMTDGVPAKEVFEELHQKQRR